MKKIIVSLFLVCAFAFVNAQDVLKSKNGTPILPEKGDWAIGVSANPFLSYFGNFIYRNDANNSSPTFDFFTGDNSIIGKYFLDDKTAIRARVRIGLTTNTYDAYITDNLAPASQVKDKETIGATNISLGLGMEKRRGKGRLQGFYGAEAMIGLASTSNKYTYGNGFSASNTEPSSTNFYDFDNNNNNINNLIDGGRATQYKSGTTFNIGVRGFIGAEYFILPKISFGGEFGWGIALSTTGAGSQSVDSWNGSTVISNTKNVSSNTSFGVDTDNLSGDIFLMLHF